jgi:hypothetical protein
LLPSSHAGHIPGGGHGIDRDQHGGAPQLRARFPATLCNRRRGIFKRLAKRALSTSAEALRGYHLELPASNVHLNIH